MKYLFAIIAFTILAPNIFQLVLDDVTYTMYRDDYSLTTFGTDHTCTVWTEATGESTPCVMQNVTITYE